jgi:hypothetical protein
MQIPAQLKELITTLERYDARELPPWQIGKSFNVLLSEAKKEQPDNPVIAAMEPVDSGPDDIYAQIDANGLAGMARQLYTALD